MSDGFHIPIDAASARLLPGPENPQFINLRERGSLTVELYRPLEIDHQQPHSRDECYVIVEGRGFFEMGDEKVHFSPGDFLFAPAGMPHRFRNFGDSMTTLVMFYGPEGGEDA